MSKSPSIPSAFEATLTKLRNGPLRLRQSIAADRLGIGQTKLRALIKAGVLESVVDGKCRYIYTESIIRYLEKLQAEQQSVDEMVSRMKRRRAQLAEGTRR
jgi:hypothetical protein